MEDVAILREAQPRLGRIGLTELLENPPHHSASVPRHSAELRQHRRPTSYHAIQNRHRQIPMELLSYAVLYWLLRSDAEAMRISIESKEEEGAEGFDTVTQGCDGEILLFYNLDWFMPYL